MSDILGTYEADYSIFLFFKRNVSVLREGRPDLYLTPGDDHGHQFAGSLANSLTQKEFRENLSTIMGRVETMNCSIVLNSTSYFEGLLENLLLRRIGKCSSLPRHLRTVIDNYRSQITRASSLTELKRHFKTLFGKSIADFLKDFREDLTFIDKFYIIRHVLAHGSRLPTQSMDVEGGGSTTQHEDPAYQELMRYLRNRYHLSSHFHCDIIMFLMFSVIIDDFSRAIFSIGEKLASILIETELISADAFWGDFRASHTYYGKI